MYKIQNNFHLLILLILFINSFEEKSNQNYCTINNYKMRMHPCDYEAYTRNISFYLTSQWILPKNITKSNPIFYYYTLPTYNVSCINCKKNEILVYNPEINDMICQKCPNGYISEGKDLKIYENWSEEIIKKYLIINCISTGNYGLKLNRECSKASISKDK